MAKRGQRRTWTLLVLAAAMSAVTCSNGGGLTPTQPAAPSEPWRLTLTLVVQNADQFNATLNEASVWLNFPGDIGPESVERGMEYVEIGRAQCSTGGPCGELSIVAADRYLGAGEYRIDVRIDEQKGFVNDYLGGGAGSTWSATTPTGRRLAGTFEQQRNSSCRWNEGFSWTIELD